MEKVISSKDCGWGNGIKVVGKPGNWLLSALDTLIHGLVDQAGEVIDIAAGVSVMKGRSVVTNEDVKQALLIYKQGLDNVLPEVDEEEG